MISNFGIRLPDPVKQGVEACTAINSRIPIELCGQLHYSIVHVSHMSLSDFLALRNQVSFDNYTKYIPGIIEFIDKHFSDKQPRTLKSIRNSCVSMITESWKLFQLHICNHDYANLIEFTTDKSSKYTSIGLKICILGQPDSISLEVQKNTYLNAFHIFQIEFFKRILNFGLKGAFFSYNLDVRNTLDTLYCMDLYLGFRVGLAYDSNRPWVVDGEVVKRMRLAGWPLPNVDGDTSLN